MKIKYFFICLVFPLLFSCSKEQTIEQQIIGTINEIEALAEAGERRKFMKLVDDDFSGQRNVLNKEEFRRLMVLQWNINRRLHAQLGPIHVNSAGPDTAQANFSGLITGGRGFIPERGQFYEFQTTWVRSGGDWLLASAQWKAISDP
ncbi:MAG: hypothetical protein ACI9H8_000271 [Lysobacterales bacterium]|jgi:hypothetical protein